MPDNWIYERCRDVASDYEAGDLTSDSVNDWADSQVDFYTKRLAEWHAKFCLADQVAQYEEDAQEIHGPKATIEEQLRAIQYLCLQGIAYAIVEAYENHR
jgi:hypothetical protein